MIENNGHIHVYRPGAGADNPMGSNFVRNHKYSINLAIFLQVFTNNDLSNT